jgi:hypothetical protein
LVKKACRPATFLLKSIFEKTAGCHASPGGVACVAWGVRMRRPGGSHASSPLLYLLRVWGVMRLLGGSHASPGGVACVACGGRMRSPLFVMRLFCSFACTFSVALVPKKVCLLAWGLGFGVRPVPFRQHLRRHTHDTTNGSGGIKGYRRHPLLETASGKKLSLFSAPVSGPVAMSFRT